MTDRQRLLPLLPALRTAACFAVMLMFGSALAMLFDIPKLNWILMTIMFVSQNGYSATRVRIQHRVLPRCASRCRNRWFCCLCWW